ncbi:MAG: NAD-glutamate dehydrogenase [Campylobacterota bacterium]|nr:NAD-glutamate dehydrogenase [Campylobacterota bacterium]
MPAENELNAICAQLLTSEDLDVSQELFEKVVREEVVSHLSLNETITSIRVFATRQLYLSEITPILHNFGFNIIDEVTYHIEHGEKRIYINRFNLDLLEPKRIEKAKSNIEFVLAEALKGDLFGQCKIFSLVYKQNITIRQVTLLRAIIEYIDQAVVELNFEAVLNTITSHDEIAKLFIHYFTMRFKPGVKKRDAQVKELEALIEESIKIVPNIMDDKILKLTYAMLRSMLRTNCFIDREAIAFKINTAEFAENLKGLQPSIEAFVYHPEFSGLHLRMSLISRGGLRWSERHEDYRTEVKSLMITQEGKNSIIIPDGAKGGFVIRREKSEITKEYFTEVYSAFIHNLLDLVDNREGDTIVRDERIVAYDGDDAYFVVAADKGTAAMSDVANSIAVERGYWLGDAFASGGSNGFGHKDLGVTAKGSLVSTARFFIEKGIDFYKESVTVVGIGSMNGDVFGNGMLESKAFKLLAAISHKEIFIDPDPIPAASFEERQRLFISKKGGWSEYNRSLISKGGGVFLRADKAIELSAEIKKMVGTSRKVLSGEELARKVLGMKVDMLFNGGVGTYVKSSDESNLDLGDKQNEAVRLDAGEVRAEIVCEGGNLGFTQKARIEYALGGGKINLDGIDNAAGVDTSDHEVNLKILLNIIASKGLMNSEEKNKTLHSLTEQVVNMVLWSNYRQALALSRDEALSCHYQKDFMMAIEILEGGVKAFNRRDFYIPKNENIRDIVSKKGSIVRPILGSMLSNAKIFVKNLLVKTELIDELFAQEYLFKYFPKSFVGAYEHEITNHPLKREIIATVIADIVINLQGSTFICDYKKLDEERFLIKIKSYLISNRLFGANDIRHEIYRQDFTMTVGKQYPLLSEIEHTLNFSTRWMVKYLNDYQIDAAHMLDYKEQLFELLGKINANKAEEIIPDNPEFNRFFSVIEYLRFAVAAIMIKENTHNSFEDVGTLFYMIVNEFKILEMISSLDEIEIISESDLKLRHQVMQFIEFIVVHYTQKVLAFQRVDETPSVAFKSYIENDKEVFENIKDQIDAFMGKEVKDIKEITVTVNQLMASAI